MAEAMIAGLLRGELVEAAQVVASHPRTERRDHLEREYGIRVVSDNVAAIDGADVVLFAIKPQMLGRVGREIGPHLRRGQLVLSVIAGATTAALTGTLGHHQVVRAMPNTPARLGKGMTVWYPTPETTPEQREQAATLLGALGKELEVDDEKFVAMATAVSGTGPTYVFLVMEALIDAAVHLGFPRHVAHDLVIETLEGSDAVRQAIGDASGGAAEHGHVAGRHERGRAPRAGSRAGFERSFPRPSGQPSGARSSSAINSRRASATARAERGARARRGTTGAEGALTGSAATGPWPPPSFARPAPRAARGHPDDRLPGGDARLLGRRGSPLGSAECFVGRARRRRVAPARGRFVGRGRPGLVAAGSRRARADWYELAAAYIEEALETGRWPTDDEYDGGDFDTFQRAQSVDLSDLHPADLRARLDAAHAALIAIGGGLSLAAIYSDAAWGWVYNVLHGHAIDHLRVLEPWAGRLRARQEENDPFGPDPQPVASGLAAAKERFWADEASVTGPIRSRHPGVAVGCLDRRRGHARLDRRRPCRSHRRLVRRGRRGARGASPVGTWREVPPEGIDAWNEIQVRAARGDPVAELLRRYETGHARLRAAVAAMSDAEWLHPEGFELGL